MRTVCLTFDNMGPAEGHEHALAVGYPRLLDALDRHGLRGRFFVEGWNGEHHPDAVAALAARGHEVALHGWVHEQWAALPADEAAALLDRGVDALTAAAGTRPVGFRAPGGERGPHTAALLAARGFAYDASLGSGPPARLPEGIVHVPFRWSGVDGYHYLQRGDGPEALLAAWTALLDKAEFVTLIAHAHLSCLDDDRFAALDAVLTRLSSDDACHVVTAAEAATAVAG